MNINELRDKLKKIKINEKYYSIYNDKYVDEGMALDFDNEKWILSYVERGEKYDKQYFKNENSACKEMYRTLVRVLKK